MKLAARDIVMALASGSFGVISVARATNFVSDGDFSMASPPHLPSQSDSGRRSAHAVPLSMEASWSATVPTPGYNLRHAGVVAATGTRGTCSSATQVTSYCPRSNVRIRHRA